MENSTSSENSTRWLDRPVLTQFPNFKYEHLLIALLLLVAVVSRFYNIGTRDMSHDEVNHVVPSYELYMGNGYSHDPVTHGPLQFHLLAATYFLFGDTDYASRVPSALFSVLTVAFVLFGFKRFLGRVGSLLASLLFLISPYMLFYGRYTRNESFVAFFGVVMLFCILYYLEKGRKQTLFLLAAVLSLQFCAKETAYIYTAIMLIFLAIVFFNDVLRKEWAEKGAKTFFSVAMIVLFVCVGLALTAATMETKASSDTQPFTNQFLQNLLPVYHYVLIISLVLAGIALVMGLIYLFIGLNVETVKNLRSFDLLVLTATLVFPLLSAFPISLVGWDPLDYSDAGIIHALIFIVAMAAIAIIVGCLWKPSIWLPSAGIFFAIFTILYTTFFTNADGFFTGMIGSLGYWLSQQGVNRGTQPWYYYAFLQIPMYEYLPALGTILAVAFGMRKNLFLNKTNRSPFLQSHVAEEEQTAIRFDPETGEALEFEKPIRVPVLGLLVFWSLMSLVAYSIAGEKMPWLTVHITLPMLLAAGWGLGYLIESIPWKKLAPAKGWLAIPLMLVFLVAVGTTVDSLSGSIRPFSGTNLDQLQVTGNFLFSALAVIASLWGIGKLLSGWNFRNTFKLCLVTLFGIFTILTARSSYQASFINYDNAKEFLVYAHGAAGPKEILKQVEEISERTTGGNDIKVAYIGDALYPYWWYFRDYSNKMWIKDTISRDLQNYPLVICDDTYLSKAQSVLGNDYVQYDYTRLWWPMMDYMNVSWLEVKSAITNPQMLRALFDIWFNKDYTLYAQIKNNPNLTLETWSPAAGLHFFISKDIVGQIWEYGTLPTTTSTAEADPYAGKYVDLTPDMFFGQTGSDYGRFDNAHGIAITSDGTIYIADSGNNRIEYFSASGEFLGSWGNYASLDENGNAPAGYFNEPWGVAVGPDGSVYVADTWNYRIQKFSADGEFITMWGTGGQGDTPYSFWGPRGIAVDSNGQVYVTDTGNKRVVVFDENGNFVAQIGSGGMENGQFDEPVGIAVDASGYVYVADTWNYRIQVFAPVENGASFTFVRSWDVDGWTSQSTQNKPYLTVDQSGNVFVTDPDNFRVLEFDSYGNFVQGWGQYSSGIDGFGTPVGLAADTEGHVWVVDAANNYVLRFSPVPNTTAAITSLPAFPISPLALNFDPATNRLVDSLGQAYYTLDTGQMIWVPIIPDSLFETLPDAVSPVLDDLGLWYILDANGNVLYQWNEGGLTWVPAEVLTVTN